MDAGNQQGRSDQVDFAHYITGFVDGEGSFHIAVQKNPTVKSIWQLIPEFHISQHVSDKHVLEMITDFFGCGYVKPNHPANPRDVTWVYVVRAQSDLIDKIIPFL